MKGSRLGAFLAPVVLGLGMLSAAIAAPVAVIGAAPNPALPGETVSFDGSGSYEVAPPNQMWGFEWDWDDDGVFDLVGVLATHVFAAEGVYPVTLRIQSATGSDTDTVLILVENSSSGVPEPATLALLGFGIAALATLGRRKR